MGKTGTTTLQNSVFQHHSEICYLGKSVEYRARGTRRGFASNILAQRLEPMLLNGKRLNPRQKDQLEKDLSELSEDNPSAKIMLASWEAISACRPARFAQLLEQLKTLNPDLHILFTIRNPVDWVASAYLQQLKGRVFGHRQRYAFPLMYRDISRWYNYFRHAWRSDLPLPFANIRTAHRLLPKGRVGVICFEHLRLEPIIFFSRISAFLGISLEETLTHTKDTHRNYSLTSVQHKYLLQLLESNSRALGLSINVATESERAQFKALQESGSVFKVDLPGPVRRRLTAAAARESRWLSTEFNLPLEELGYPL